MDVKELKSRFGELIPLLREMNSLNQSIEDKYNKQAELYKRKDVSSAKDTITAIITLEVVIGFLGVMSFVMIYGIWFSYLTASLEQKMIMLFFFLLIVYIVVAGLFNKYKFKDLELKAVERIRRLNEEFELGEKELSCERERAQQLLRLIGEKIIIVPPNYQYLMAIEYMYSYFCNGRADTLKEAINLYEEDLFRMRQEYRSEQMVGLQEQQAYNTARIQQAATVTAVATSVNTINNLMRK